MALAGVPQLSAATLSPQPHGWQPRSALSLVKVPLDGTRISKMVPALDVHMAGLAGGGTGLWQC